jgi:2'-5' RNA ligase
MAKERLKSARARLFVALDLPDPVQAGLADWQARALTDPALRPVRPEALHVTLCFLGYHRERDIERLAALVTGVDARPIEIRLDPDPVSVPASRPRLFAVGGDSPAASALQAELSDRLEAERFYEPEKRPFWTHVTAARVRSETGPRGHSRRGRPMQVDVVPDRLPTELTKSFGAVRVALYRSILRPSGAEYTSLAELELPPPRAEKR